MLLFSTAISEISVCVSEEMFVVLAKAWIDVFPGTCLFICSRELKFLSPLVKICVHVVCFMSSEVKRSHACVYVCYLCSRLPRRREKTLYRQTATRLLYSYNK